MGSQQTNGLAPENVKFATERLGFATERLSFASEKLVFVLENVGVIPGRLNITPERFGVATESFGFVRENLGLPIKIWPWPSGFHLGLGPIWALGLMWDSGPNHSYVHCITPNPTALAT